MTSDQIIKLFDDATVAGPATIQILTDQNRDRQVISKLFDQFEQRAGGLGWLIGRVTLSEEADKYPGMPIRYHLEDALRDWLKPGAANAKLLTGVVKARGTKRMPGLLLIDGSEFPEDQRLLSVKEQIRDLSNRQTELNLWIVFAVDPRTARLSPTVASEPSYDVKLES